MATIRVGFLALLAAAVLGQSGAAAGQPGRQPEQTAQREQSRDVRVMSYNIRYGTANDGENHWDKRKEWLVEAIRAFDPDLLGTQEALGFQRDYLGEMLPGHEKLGVGRDDGKERGEMMALYYDKDRFELVESGHFWLSEAPDQPGSRSWAAALPRMVTWAKLRDRRQPEALPIAMFDTHFDHQSAQARLESARLLRRRAATIGKGCSIIVTGDFNTGEDTEPYRALYGEVEGQASPLVDTYRLANPARAAGEGTSSGFKASATSGPRIDWIAASRDWQVVEAKIDRTARDGRTPSDHFAVTAVLRRDDSPRDAAQPPHDSN